MCNRWNIKLLEIMSKCKSELTVWPISHTYFCSAYIQLSITQRWFAVINQEPRWVKCMHLEFSYPKNRFKQFYTTRLSWFQLPRTYSFRCIVWYKVDDVNSSVRVNIMTRVVLIECVILYLHTSHLFYLRKSI